MIQELSGFPAKGPHPPSEDGEDVGIHTLTVHNHGPVKQQLEWSVSMGPPTSAPSSQIGEQRQHYMESILQSNFPSLSVPALSHDPPSCLVKTTRLNISEETVRSRITR